MRTEEIEEEATERPMFRHERSPVLNVGHMVTLGLATVINLVVFAFGYGSLMQKTDQNSDDIAAMKRQEITPGAAQRISVIEARMSAQNQADWEWKREIKEQLKDINQKLDEHMDGRSK